MPDENDSGSLIRRSTEIDAGVGGFLAAVVAFQPQLAIFAGLGAVGWLVLASILLAAAFGLFFQRRRRRSRLLDPDGLRLDPGNAAHLLGRAAEVEDLARICEASRFVFLSGDSGAGKSALIRAGLVPRLLGDPRWRPILIDMGNRDFDRGLLAALGEAFWHSLTEDERTKLHLQEFPPVDRALVALSASRQTTGRLPFIFLDQIDDYQLRHRDRFIDPQLHSWQSTDVILAASEFWRWLADALQRDQLGVLLVTRSDNYNALDSLRLCRNPEPISYPLRLLPAGYVVPIVERLTQRPTDARSVVADPEAGWSALIERLGLDLEQGGQILPQQLKITLLGLQALRPLNVRGYERIGRAEGLEALFVESAVADAAAASGLDRRHVLDLLLALVDRTNRRKDEPRSPDQLLSVARLMPADAPRVIRSLGMLEARELVRATSGGWQLDHDYLARGILRAEANAERWRARVAQLARQHEGASGAWNWWRTLLTPWEQVLILLAWLRRRPYGIYGSFARMSMVRLLPPLCVALLGMFVTYAAGEYLNSSIPLNVLSYDTKLNDDEAAALATLATRSPLTRGFFAWRAFHDRNHAQKAGPKSSVMARAITRLDARAAAYFRDRLVIPALSSSEPAIRVYAVASLGSIEATANVVNAVLSALSAAKGDPSETSALAQVYAVAARKLPEETARASEALAAMLDALIAVKGDPSAIRDLAQAYATAAQKLPEGTAHQAVAAVLHALVAAKGDPSAASALAQVYAVTAEKLPEDTASVPEAIAAILDTMIAVKGDPSATRDLAQAYATAAQKLPEDKARADEAVAAVLNAIIASNGNPIVNTTLTQAYAAAASKLPASIRHYGTLKLILAAGWCFTQSAQCLQGMTNALQTLDADLSLATRTARLVEILKFPQSATLDPSPLAQLAATPQATAEAMPADLWGFVAWVAGRYPNIDLTSGPSLERLIAVGGT